MRNIIPSPALPGTQQPGAGTPPTAIYRPNPATAPPAAAPAPQRHGPPSAAPTGMHWEGGGPWRPFHLVANPATPAPSPVPGVPRPGTTGIQPTSQPPGAGGLPGVARQTPGMSPGPGQPSPGPPQPGGGPGGPPAGPGGTPQPGAYNDPYSALLAAVPLMQQQMTQNLAGAEAQAGFTGNRFGTYGADAASRVGAQTSMQMNQMLLQTMQDQANRDQQNALTASGQGIQLGQAQNQMDMQKLMSEFGIGQYEQNRQDQFSNTAFQDWQQNRLGWLGPAMQLAMGQHAGSTNPGQIYQTTQPGSAGALDYASALGPLLAAFL